MNDGQEKTFIYTKFNDAELDIFCDILDVEKNGVINLADLDHASKNLGLESLYPNVRDLLKPLIKEEKRGVTVEDLKAYLKSNEKNMDEEMTEIFEFLDYDKKGTISKHKIKIIAKELCRTLLTTVSEEVSDAEADDMIRLFAKADSNSLTKEEFMNIQKIKMDA
jgi:Ca2+-binding EF-hand superfamily protein